MTSKYVAVILGRVCESHSATHAALLWEWPIGGIPAGPDSDSLANADSAHCRLRGSSHGNVQLYSTDETAALRKESSHMLGTLEELGRVDAEALLQGRAGSRAY